MSAVRNIANTSGRCRPNVCWFTGYCFYISRLNSIRVLLLCVISFTVSFRAVIIPSLEALREPESGNSSMRTRLPQPFPAVKAGVQAAPSFSLVVRESRTYFRWPPKVPVARTMPKPNAYGMGRLLSAKTESVHFSTCGAETETEIWSTCSFWVTVSRSA